MKQGVALLPAQGLHTPGRMQSIAHINYSIIKLYLYHVKITQDAMYRGAVNIPCGRPIPPPILSLSDTHPSMLKPGSVLPAYRLWAW